MISLFPTDFTNVSNLGTNYKLLDQINNGLVRRPLQHLKLNNRVLDKRHDLDSRHKLYKNVTLHINLINK